MTTKQDIQNIEDTPTNYNSFEFLNPDGTPKFELFSDILICEQKCQLFDENAPFHTEFSETFSKSLAILKKSIDSQELSKRIFELTDFLLHQNPSDILVWWYRKRILESIKNVSIDSELQFSNRIFRIGLKSYQAWEHRKWIILYFNFEPTTDYLRQMTNIMDQDVRNFHAWSHLIWLSSQYKNISSKIFDITTDYITKDKKNGSAWNARFTISKFIFQNINDYMHEIDFAFGLIGIDI